MEKRKIVFLYTELATYFLACVDKLSLLHNVDVHIVRWPVNAEAPFRFTFSNDRFRIYDRQNYTETSLSELIRGIDPDLIYCSGWTDKAYLSVCKEYKKKGIPTIVGLDNQWKGSIKQQLASVISPFKILNRFSHCWVPGILQQKFASKLGFKDSTILTGFYSCDLEVFLMEYEANRENKKKDFPKRFIYAGRYYEFKGIKDLWTAFIELQKEEPNEWELWCLGTGDIEPVQHEKIKHFGFVQPNDLPKILKETGVFILPSHFEPWGVVVHEFAASGFPLIVSDAVGARFTFVENQINGYIYKAGDVNSLKNVLKRMMSKSEADLWQMGERSVTKANLISPEIWSDTLMKILNDKNAEFHLK